MKTKKKMQKNMEKKKHKFQNPAKSTPYERRISAERVSGKKEEKGEKGRNESELDLWFYRGWQRFCLSE